MRKLLLVVLSLFIITPVFAANDKAFLWQVSSGENSEQQNVVYLMGSIHFADQSFYPLRKEIEDAFNRSSRLVVELDINAIDVMSYNKILQERGSFRGDQTIEDVLSEDTFSELRESLDSLDVDYEAVKKYKPGILVLTLSALQVVQMGFDPELGIDAYFLRKAAKQSDMQIIELETMQQQLSLFIDIPDGELLLKESLYSLSESETLMADMVRIWKEGNEPEMSRLLFEDTVNEYPAFSTIYDSLFYERNKKMVARIEDMLQQAGEYFVVVGSGHLVGEEGIVNVLKEKGYRVKRL